MSSCQLSEISEKVIALTFKHLEKNPIPLDVTFVGKSDIRKLNKKHRGINKATDVLSFPLEEPTHLGDIVIAIDIATKQAKEYGHSFEREIAFLTLHGLLHLLGYDHDAMEPLYEPILEKAGFPL